MRIAYVINSMEGGGAAAPVPAVTRVIRDLGATVRVFALTRRNGRALPAIEAAGLEPAVRPGGEHDHRAAFAWLSEETGRWGATHLWTSLTRSTLLGLLLGPRRGLPVICWQHNAFLKTGNRLMLRAMQKRAALWIADSACVAELTSQRLAVEPARLVTWPIFSADPGAPVASAWQPGETLRLGSLGRLHPNKGYDLLIAALGRLHTEGFRAPVPYSISIRGEGSERERLLGLQQSHGVTGIQFEGYADNPRQYLAGLHLYLQPSRREGFCIAAHEAMTAGLPVLGSATGEMPHSILPGVTGAIAIPGDVASLAQCLRTMLADPGQLHAMGLAGRQRVLERFSQQHFNAAGAEVYRRLLAATA